MKQKQKLKKSLHELLGRFFALSTWLALPLFKIARLIILMVLWRCQRLHWNWYYLYLPPKNIQFPKFYCWKSNTSLDHWEDDVHLQDLFLSNWFLFSTFSCGNTMKISKILWGFTPAPTRALPWTHWRGAHSAPHPTNLQLIIAIAAPLFSENGKKKNDQLIFPYFDHCLGESKFTRANWALGPTHSWRTKQLSVSIPRAHTYT